MKKNKTENFKFFNNSKCEYFPCHKTDLLENFNCLFCYCPLYALGDQCGGDFSYTEKGIKNCSKCSIPHKRECYDRIIDKMGGILEIAKKK
ncbi:metal-binding protein [Alkalibaculum sp. M08DMB]|uniref:Metal-binding protein n=1 Tax=Alkalibaculum sporogenes TaxID=2655001 RepID=A0A6A7K8L6_9FIRM|nr:cysteine-rich small domain-containing protein [Alkalibaculum sporogenes]MPW25705.1 metal-binding protein [Alkalibaculum sporogenes]